MTEPKWMAFWPFTALDDVIAAFQAKYGQLPQEVRLPLAEFIRTTGRSPTSDMPLLDYVHKGVKVRWMEAVRQPCLVGPIP